MYNVQLEGFIMSSKYKDLEGAIGVNSDKTPITRRDVPTVDASEWANMSLIQLVNQREALANRLMMAGENYAMQTAIRRGLARLDAIIASKQTDDIHLIR